MEITRKTLEFTGDISTLVGVQISLWAPPLNSRPFSLLSLPKRLNTIKRADVFESNFDQRFHLVNGTSNFVDERFIVTSKEGSIQLNALQRGVDVSVS